MAVRAAASAGRWIRREIQIILWPPGSPDLIRIDYLFWDYIKNYSIWTQFET
jgi:hypothetical protein